MEGPSDSLGQGLQQGKDLGFQWALSRSWGTKSHCAGLCAGEGSARQTERLSSIRNSLSEGQSPFSSESAAQGVWVAWGEETQGGAVQGH